jgi:hypothetical protein
MSQRAEERRAYGELLYEYTLRITGVTEYGGSLQAVLGGEAPPACGLRVDIAFQARPGAS